MIQPVLNANTRKSVEMGVFSGIGTENLYDAVNLVCNGECHTRNKRTPAMLCDRTPDQIIPCESRLFFRFGNLLKEIIQNEDGTLAENGTVYSLNELSPAPDRRVILWEDEVYVLPDNIRVGSDIWLPFGEEYEPSVLLPFINPRTFFYPSSYYGYECCEDAFLLRVGMKLRFSWIPSEAFTVKTIEPRQIIYEDSVIDEGIRITLDRDVPYYNALPSDASVEYTDPVNRPILNDLMLGYNQKIFFSGRSVAATDSYGGHYFSFKNYFKNGQMVSISGSSAEENNLKAKILSVNDTTLQLDCEFKQVTEPEGTVITITPLIPDFSHFLLTEDRLFGVDNVTGKFYISELKNPFMFCDFPTLPEDSWSVKINGTATGIALWKDCVICFTEDGGFRILGYHALNFGLRQLSVNGIKNGEGGSLVRVGDTLYYSSEKGIMKYSGGSDRKIINTALHVSKIESTVTDGNFVYILSNNRIWVYDTETEYWWSEDAQSITGLFKFSGQKYLKSPEAIYLEGEEPSEICDWSFELPIFRKANRKKIIPLDFSLDCLSDTDCALKLYFKAYGDNVWKRCGSYRIKGENAFKAALPKIHCKGFKIKVEGKGAFYPDFWSIAYKEV